MLIMSYKIFFHLWGGVDQLKKSGEMAKNASFQKVDNF